MLTQSTSIKYLDLGIDNVNTFQCVKGARDNEKKVIPHLPNTEESFDTLLSLDIPTDKGHVNRSPASHRIVTSLLLSYIHEWKSVEQLHLTGLHATYIL